MPMKMPIDVALWVLAAALMHAAWNAIVKSSASKFVDTMMVAIVPGLLAIVLSPLVGFLLALVLVAIVSWASVRSTPFAVDRAFRILQFASASLYSLGHGGNDAQKTMGIIAAILYAHGELSGDFHVQIGRAHV